MGSSTGGAWKPRLVALDIDGTLLRWVDGAGTTYGEIPPAVGAPVPRSRAAGPRGVLAGGGPPHGMPPVADLLGLSLGGAGPLWIGASTGAVFSRSPPL